MTPSPFAYFLESPDQPLVRRNHALPEPGPNEVSVEVLACGLCHTDLGFASGGVRPNHALPLVLGHEVVGRVVAAGSSAEALLGQAVLVPAVLPCGDCLFCQTGRSNACPEQKMPGNDIHGGFASHILVPARPLVPLVGFSDDSTLLPLCVVADAVSTAWQAVRRAELAEGDLACIVGAGGVGGFVAQIARALGAQVIAGDVDSARLDALRAQGIEGLVGIGADPRAARAAYQEQIRASGVPSLRMRIFECSGTTPGQALAFRLLQRCATLVQVGYTRDPVELRLSNLMAFDATIHGTWGCPPAEYPAVLELVRDGRIALAPFIEVGPMSDLNKYLEAMRRHELPQRMVLDPRR